MTYDYFVAGRWRNKENVQSLMNSLRQKGYSVYSFLDDSSAESPEEFMKNFESKDWKTDPYIHKVFEQDMDAEKSSKAFILLLPAGKSSHIEAGAAYGMGKRCILIGKQEEAESLYCIFNEVYETQQEFLLSLPNMNK